MVELRRSCLGHIGGRLILLYANGEARKRRFWCATPACKDSRKGSNPYPTSSLDESPPFPLSQCPSPFGHRWTFTALKEVYPAGLTLPQVPAAYRCLATVLTTMLRRIAGDPDFAERRDLNIDEANLACHFRPILASPDGLARTYPFAIASANRYSIRLLLQCPPKPAIGLSASFFSTSIAGPRP